MSSCLSGGGRTAYGIDLEIIKSLSTSTITSHSSSPSSTISESSNSPGAISTQKARTSRKRHNQTYGEAAALLSTAYPNIFSANDFFKPCRFIKSHEFSSFCFEDSSDELLMPFSTDNPPFQIDSAVSEKPCLNDTHDYGCQTNASKLCDGYEVFDAESILDEEIEDGVIDSIMGVAQEEKIDDCHYANGGSSDVGGRVDFCYGYPLGLGLGLGRSIDFGFGTAREGILKAFRQNDEGDWWKCPTVNMSEISPRFNKPMLPQKKKKKKKKTKKLMNLNDILSSPVQSKENSVPVAKPILTGKEVSTPNPKSSSTSCIKSSAGMILKLNYDEVLKACSDKGSPYSEDLPGSEFSGTDVMTRLAQIDLFGENGGLREASVQRYKEKRRSRLFFKKIRYQVRKVNAEQRPRVKGRFVRSLNSSGGEETRTE